MHQSDRSAAQTATEWLDRFAAALGESGPEAGNMAALFARDCYWRDLLTFTWNVTTMEGWPAIAAMLASQSRASAPGDIDVTSARTIDDGTTEAWFTFRTDVLHGSGCLRLEAGLCRTLFTMAEDIIGHEEPRGPRRPQGLTHRADRQRVTWAESRAREAAELGRSRQPQVAIIGGGQGGIMLAARLKALGVPAVVIERNARPGDSWRNRYRSLVLHDPVWYDHLPYIPFPETWPVFTPKDKMGDWLEAYTLAMELDYWGGTECTAARREGGLWEIDLKGADRPARITAPHLVFATGAYGPPRMPDWPGMADFAGPLIHSSAYASGTPFAGKRVAVVGAASSAHDVAVDLWEAGAEVTMVQRSPTTVVRSETLMALGFDIYSEDALARGITTEIADRMVAATPFALMPEGQRALYREIRARDADFYAALAATGFLLDFGPDETGLMMKAYRTGSGYYIDVGASQLIIDGRIGVAAGSGVARVLPQGLALEDGRLVEAEAIVVCTGYQSMHETVAALVSRRTADRVGPCWGLGSGVPGDPGPWQGEPRNMWKPTAEEGLWFHGGNLALSRFYSRILALQLKARTEGIATPVWGAPEAATG